jgi:hypothetical protein
MASLVALAAFGLSLPARPTLSTPSLPLKLVGGLLLFGTSVPEDTKPMAAELQALAQRTLRSDPILRMELGEGVEAGGIFASATSPDEDALIINFQINGGNAWAESTAFGVVDEDGNLELIDVTVANLASALVGETSLTITPVHMSSKAVEPAVMGKVVPTSFSRRAGKVSMGLFDNLKKAFFSGTTPR